MMHHFLSSNRDELTARCRAKVSQRPGRAASSGQLKNGIPIFLDQLIRTLKLEQSKQFDASRRLSGAPGGGTASSEIGTFAAQHGKDLLKLGFSVDQVVHDYGDLCQAITDLAVERNTPFLVDEFRTLNRCLDNAIAEAVTEFSYHKDSIAAEKHAADANERAGHFVHELRNLLGTASLAFVAAKAGNLSLTGATGSILERSIASLGRLIDASITDIRATHQQHQILNSFSLAAFIREASAAAELSAQAKGVRFSSAAVDSELAICGNRELLLAALANLLQNAFKFTQPQSEVFLNAYASADRILIDVQDHCGGLHAGAAETMFIPFAREGADRTGLGLGLTIAKQAVEANGGTLSVQDLPGSGCIFTISLARHVVPT